MDTITRGLSEYAVGLHFEDIDPETVHQTKIRLIDSMACGLAAFDGPVGRAVRAVASGASGRPGATVLGTTHRSSPELAAFANSAMVRFLDFNDTYHALDSGHPSDQIPGVLALAETVGADGKEVITSIVLAYEVFCGLCDVANICWGQGKWYNATWGAIASAVAASKILKLSPEETANAIGITVVSHAALGVITKGEHVPLWHACSDPNAVRQGVFGALLAKEGLDGPPRPFEGRKGFFDAISGPFQLPDFGGSRVPFRINNTLIKNYATCSQLQTTAEAAVQVHRQLPPGTEIIQVDVITNSHTYEVCARPEKWHPRGHKAAHLSLPYCVAVALMDGAVGLDQITEEKIYSPEVHQFMQRVRASEDEEFSKRYPRLSMSAVEVLDKQGGRYRAEAGFTQGFPQDPMGISTVEQRFREITKGLLLPEQQSRALEWMRQLEDQRDMAELFQNLEIDRGGKG